MCQHWRVRHKYSQVSNRDSLLNEVLLSKRARLIETREYWSFCTYLIRWIRVQKEKANINFALIQFDNINHEPSTLGLAKRDLWGLGAESWFVLASLPFAQRSPGHKDSLLQQIMTLLQGPKDPVLPSLMYVHT